MSIATFCRYHAGDWRVLREHRTSPRNDVQPYAKMDNINEKGRCHVLKTNTQFYKIYNVLTQYQR